MIDLAFLRNQLFNERFGPKEKELLTAIEKKIRDYATPFSPIALEILKNCRRSIEKGNLKSAGYEIDLIHNFPLTPNDKKWNSEWFYSGELLSYIENCKDVERIKKLIKLLSNLQDQLEKPRTKFFN